MKDQAMTLHGSMHYRGVSGKFKSSASLYEKRIKGNLLKAYTLQ